MHNQAHLRSSRFTAIFSWECQGWYIRRSNNPLVSDSRRRPECMLWLCCLSCPYNMFNVFLHKTNWEAKLVRIFSIQIYIYNGVSLCTYTLYLHLNTSVITRINMSHFCILLLHLMTFQHNWFCRYPLPLARIHSDNCSWFFPIKALQQFRR